MSDERDIEFTKKVMLKLIAAGCVHGINVTFKSGFFTYMLPMWVHYYHLKLLVAFSGKWCDTVAELLNNPTNKK